MSASHTPGPWELQQIETKHHGYDDWPTFAVRSLQNVCLAVVGAVDHYQSERNPANARLIAAAPALLAALDILTRACEARAYVGPDSPAVTQARAVLKEIGEEEAEP